MNEPEVEYTFNELYSKDLGELEKIKRQKQESLCELDANKYQLISSILFLHSEIEKKRKR